MVNPWRFLRSFLSLLASAAYVLTLLALAFASLALALAYAERTNLSFWQSIYLSAITALTVGYGDFAPKSPIGRVAAIGLGFLGVLLTGVVVAAAIKALERAEKKNG